MSTSVAFEDLKESAAIYLNLGPIEALADFNLDHLKRRCALRLWQCVDAISWI